MFPTMMFTEFYSALHDHMESSTMYFNTLATLILLFLKVSLIMPAFLLILLYINMLFITVCGYMCGLKDPSPENKSWNTLKYPTYLLWHYIGRFWHGHEVEGIENVPSRGPALLVFYHGATPIEFSFVKSDIYFLKNRQCRIVSDNFLNFLPGWGTGFKLIGGSSANFEMCIKILSDGHLLAISPGGVYESQFGDSNYRLEWRNRLGYAKVAMRAKVPIIPFFTVNNREAYCTVNIGNSFFKKLYLKWRAPCKPIYGGYPVKLRTVFGEPIPYDPTLTAEQLDMKVRKAMEQLIKDHQKLPGSIAMALLDRIYCPKTMKAA